MTRSAVVIYFTRLGFEEEEDGAEKSLRKVGRPFQMQIFAPPIQARKEDLCQFHARLTYRAEQQFLTQEILQPLIEQNTVASKKAP